MGGRDDFIASLKAALPSLQASYPIRLLGLFGSAVRSDVTESSDLDVLVEFTRPIPLSRFLALEEELTALTGRKVDLVSRQALKPHIGENVMRDLVIV